MPASKLGNGKCLRETEKALLVELEDHDNREVWIPKSVIHDDSEVFDSEKNAEGSVVVQEWWAMKENL